MALMNKVTTCLWFDGDAEAFKDARITGIIKSDGIVPVPKDPTMVVRFELAGQAFSGLNGRP